MASGKAGPERVAAAEADLALRENVPDLLQALPRHLVDVLDAGASVVSRIVGEMLVQLAEHTGPNVNLKQLGHGYLIADYPLTQEVLEVCEARCVALDDPEADAAEARLLRELGFHNLLMAPLVVEERPWALVEVYGFAESRFGKDDERVATALAAAAGGTIERLGSA